MYSRKNNKNTYLLDVLKKYGRNCIWLIRWGTLNIGYFDNTNYLKI